MNQCFRRLCKFQVVRFFQIIIVRSRRNQSYRRITRASSDAGPKLAGRESHAAMESPQALMRPLEKGVRGIEIGHQMPAEEQRSGGHALWCARRPDVPLEKGVRGI